MTKKTSVWDILAWIAFVIFIIYLLLRAVGVLSSPPAADIIAIVSAGYFIGRYAMKIDSIYEDTELLKKDVANLNRTVFAR